MSKDVCLCFALLFLASAALAVALLSHLIGTKKRMDALEDRLGRLETHRIVMTGLILDVKDQIDRNQRQQMRNGLSCYQSNLRRSKRRTAPKASRRRRRKKALNRAYGCDVC